MKNYLRIDWLMANADAVVRYRTQAELMPISNKASLQGALAALLVLPQVQKRLDLLKNLDFNRTHGSDSTHLENVLPMLNDFGLYHGMDAFDHAVGNISDIAEIVLNEGYDKLIAYPFLIRSRFPMSGLMDYAIGRVNTIYSFTRHMDFDIYDDPQNHKGVPKAFRDRPIIKPSIACDTVSGGVNIRVPLIYDIVMFAEIYDYACAEIREKIDNIIKYTISPEYDIVVPMYGILPAPPRKYYAMGWDCKKPFNDGQGYANPNLQRLLLYSRFPAATKSTWFANAIDYLTQYKTPNSTYIFPKNYLVEKDCNWVLGMHMSLAENRRKKQYAEIESTFYMLSLLKCL
ncbi:MAG: hypothetical protein FWC16_13415 [Defluviitaleaceae bacterium]|nr:hypothetical protein [Defluviitaleaceae bacterium]MCL2275919.1 hypothetical protein [Defluviitaleaceae bacterium]